MATPTRAPTPTTKMITIKRIMISNTMDTMISSKIMDIIRMVTDTMTSRKRDTSSLLVLVSNLCSGYYNADPQNAHHQDGGYYDNQQQGYQDDYYNDQYYDQGAAGQQGYGFVFSSDWVTFQ